MPSRNRHKEARRAQRRASLLVPPPAPSLAVQVEQAWAEHLDGGWCCPDCDPHHPANITNGAIEEIAQYKERHRDR